MGFNKFTTHSHTNKNCRLVDWLQFWQQYSIVALVSRYTRNEKYAPTTSWREPNNGYVLLQRIQQNRTTTTAATENEIDFFVVRMRKSLSKFHNTFAHLLVDTHTAQHNTNTAKRRNLYTIHNLLLLGNVYGAFYVGTIVHSCWGRWFLFLFFFFFSHLIPSTLCSPCTACTNHRTIAIIVIIPKICNMAKFNALFHHTFRACVCVSILFTQIETQLELVFLFVVHLLHIYTTYLHWFRIRNLWRAQDLCGSDRWWRREKKLHATDKSISIFFGDFQREKSIDHAYIEHHHHHRWRWRRIEWNVVYSRFCTKIKLRRQFDFHIHSGNSFGRRGPFRPVNGIQCVCGYIMNDVEVEKNHLNLQTMQRK